MRCQHDKGLQAVCCRTFVIYAQDIDQKYDVISVMAGGISSSLKGETEIESSGKLLQFLVYLSDEFLALSPD